MRYPRIALFLLAAILSALVGCTPSVSEGGAANTYIDSTFDANISTLYGYGGKALVDSTHMKVASDFKWKDSLGVLHSLSELRGRVVVLNFWATWCQYCTYEMPDLQATADSVASKGVCVIGVSTDVGDAIFKKVQDYVTYMKLRYQIVIDPNAYTFKNYGGYGTWPWTYIIDRTGHIAIEMVGKQTETKFIEAINRVL